MHKVSKLVKWYTCAVLSNITQAAEWELDCYSRPGLVDGKKLWEVLITDSTGQFRLCEALPLNRVNSTIDEAEVKPNTIRLSRQVGIRVAPTVRVLHFPNSYIFIIS